MDVRLITGDGIEKHPVDDLATLLRHTDGVVWVDIPSCDAAAARVLSEVFGFHPMAVRDCVERNRVPKMHAYPDHVLVALHAPERGERGHVHYVELDQIVGPNYVVTVHGPVNWSSGSPAETSATRRSSSTNCSGPGTDCSPYAPWAR